MEPVNMPKKWKPEKPHRTVAKPWGKEIWFAHTPHYLGKIILIRKGCRLSLQYHKKKHETLFVLHGQCEAQVYDKKYRLRPGWVIPLPPKTPHRFKASGGPLTLLEVSTSEPEDVVRLEDDYGRSKKH